MTIDMRKYLIAGFLQFAVVICAAGIGLPQSRVQAGEKDGSENLLEGELAKNWTTKGNWKISEGVVLLDPRPGEQGWSRWDAWLWSNKQYKDFEIQFDYKVQKGGNSGFYFRVGDKNDPVAKGIEVQIYESHAKGPDAKLTDHDSGGIIPGIPPTKNAAKPAGEWNHFHITNKADKLTVKLNGEVVNEVDLTKAAIKIGQPPASSAFRITRCPSPCVISSSESYKSAGRSSVTSRLAGTRNYEIGPWLAERSRRSQWRIALAWLLEAWFTRSPQDRAGQRRECAVQNCRFASFAADRRSALHPTFCR